MRARFYLPNLNPKDCAPFVASHPRFYGRQVQSPRPSPNLLPFIVIAAIRIFRTFPFDFVHCAERFLPGRIRYRYPSHSSVKGLKIEPAIQRRTHQTHPILHPFDRGQAGSVQRAIYCRAVVHSNSSAIVHFIDPKATTKSGSADSSTGTLSSPFGLA